MRDLLLKGKKMNVRDQLQFMVFPRALDFYDALPLLLARMNG